MTIWISREGNVSAAETRDDKSGKSKDIIKKKNVFLLVMIYPPVGFNNNSKKLCQGDYGVLVGQPSLTGKILNDKQCARAIWMRHQKCQFTQGGPMLRQTLKEKGSVLVGGAWDVLSAKILKKAGYDAVHMNSFCIAGINGVPDVSLIAWPEYLEYTRRMVAIADIPVVVDGEQGFGYKNIAAHTFSEFERVGMDAFHIDDKGDGAHCPYLGKPDVVPLDEIVAKIEAIVKARKNPDVMIIGRSSAAQRYGFDEMMKRLKAFKKAGADALWPSVWKLDELQKVVEAFPDTPLCLSLTPYKEKEFKGLTVEAATKLGYSMIFFSTTIFFKAVKESLEAAIRLKETGDTRSIWPGNYWMDEFLDLVELDQKWK